MYIPQVNPGASQAICICQQLHSSCDRSTCESASFLAYATPVLPVEATEEQIGVSFALSTLRDTATRGCKLCRVLLKGIETNPPPRDESVFSAETDNITAWRSRKHLRLEAPLPIPRHVIDYRQTSESGKFSLYFIVHSLKLPEAGHLCHECFVQV